MEFYWNNVTEKSGLLKPSDITDCTVYPRPLYARLTVYIFNVQASVSNTITCTTSKSTKIKQQATPCRRLGRYNLYILIGETQSKAVNEKDTIFEGSQSVPQVFCQLLMGPE
jgi:hypothetical protein